MPGQVLGLHSAKQGAPLIKWPGGKRWLAPKLQKIISEVKYLQYYEPFCGGAAVFFFIGPERAILSDTNGELINLYQQVKEDPEAVIAALRALKNSEQDYYMIRSMRPRIEARRAARMLYLTTLAFNGIYRVNLRGKFNVPYSYKTEVKPCNAAAIRMASHLLQNVQLFVGDFEDIAAQAKSNDLIYFDPPYTVAHGNNGFIKYNDRILQWEDQLRLACVACAAAERGCKVIVSNADHPSIRNLYRSFRMEVVRRVSVIAADGAHRRRVTECLFYNF